jgi:steroid delta-isomerase-like uncharacterized protein
MGDAQSVAERYAREVWQERRMDVIDELFSDDHAYHDALLPDLPRGPEGVRQRVGTYLGAIPDATLTMEEWVENGDASVVRWTWGGTNTGELLGIPPTGKSATTTGVHVFHVRGGKIVETWVSYDAVGFLQQLGLVAIGPQG